jgi:hypothetical protein
MPRNGKVYISHTPEDDAQIASLLATLKAEHVDVWYERDPIEQLDDVVRCEITERDAFIRILTNHTATSRQMAQELEEFERAQAADDRRARINLIMDPAYERQPTDVGTLTINTTNKPETAWLPSVLAEMGKLKASAEIPTHTLTVIVGIAVVIAIIVLFGGLYLMLTHAVGSQVPIP